LIEDQSPLQTPSPRDQTTFTHPLQMSRDQMFTQQSRDQMFTHPRRSVTSCTSQGGGGQEVLSTGDSIKFYPSKPPSTPQSKHSSIRMANSLSSEELKKMQKGRTSTLDGKSKYPDVNNELLNFHVEHFFMLGSPLSLVLALQNINKSNKNKRPHCSQVYNVFYSSDPNSTRIEPLIDEKFAQIPSAKIPNFRYFPYGDEQPINIGETLLNNSVLFTPNHSPRLNSNKQLDRQQSFNMRVLNTWWGDKRIDYSLFSPSELSTFPLSSLAHLHHASFWESTDFAAFAIRQMFNQEQPASSNNYTEEVGNGVTFDPPITRQKWKHKRTSFKIGNLNANHRSKDMVVLEGSPQHLAGKFCYGPLDMVSLHDESVDLYVHFPNTSEWKLLSSQYASHGKLNYILPVEDKLQRGLYQIRMLVRGDMTHTESYLAVIPPQLESVVFSIDGSFTTNFSILANDPKVRPSAVDVVRRWQQMGYVIIYVTARPDLQKKRVTTWLAHHNFPHGPIFFCDTNLTNFLATKTNTLKSIQKECNLQYVAAYGSSKDIAVYNQLPIPHDKIYILGKSKKQTQNNCTWLPDGYPDHLDDLHRPEILSPAKFDAKEIFGKRSFRNTNRRKSKKDH